VLVWAEVWCLWGWSAGAAVAFPIGLVAYGLTIQPTLVAPLGFALQGFTAVSAQAVGRALGVSIVREGLVLRGDNFAFVIAQACSGMNSLLALLSLASIWAYVVRGSPGSRAAILCAVLPLAVAANTTRVACVLIVANVLGEDAATGFFHGASSAVLFLMACAGMLAVSRLVGCRALATV
jgi:exosortase